MTQNEIKAPTAAGVSAEEASRKAASTHGADAGLTSMADRRAAAADDGKTGKPGNKERTPEQSQKEREDHDAKVKAAQETASKARVELGKAQAKLAATLNPDGSKKSPEQLEMDKLQEKVVDAEAELASVEGSGTTFAQTVTEAKTLVVPEHGPDMDSGHWRAQKFGNDPSNPQPAPGIPDGDEFKTVQLTRVTPDLPKGQVQTTWVHEKMAGDYERAGWNRA